MAIGLSLAFAASAGAAIPASLTSSCAAHAPAPGFSYTFCDDGVPGFGGTTPNLAGANAITVPASYGGDTFTGLPAKAADAALTPGADATGNVALDVDLSYPTGAGGPVPLIVFMHGCCAGNKTGWEATGFDAGGEKWHYSNAWFASRGYAVINYTARGFVDGNNHGSTGETHLDSRSYEINDMQSLACQVAAAFNASPTLPDIDPSTVVATGGSYGGGFSWMALTDPKWTCTPDTGTTTPMSLAAVAPKFGWTDLVSSLVPTGTQFGEPGSMPATNGCDSGPRRIDGSPCTGFDPQTPAGIAKQSINAGLYASGKTGIPPGSAHTTFPAAIDEAQVCLTGPYPPETSPLCGTTLQSTLPEFLRERSAYYQNQFFAQIASDPSYRVPVFDAATFTDPLFPAIENRRMINRLEAVATANGFTYPVQAYYGDYQHFTRDKAKIWGDVCDSGGSRHVCTTADFGGNLNVTPASLQRLGVTTRLNRFIDHYATPAGDPAAPQPSFDVTAELEVCDQTASSLGAPPDEGGPQFTASTFEALAPSTLNLDLRGSQATTSTVAGNTHAIDADPVQNTATNGSNCVVETNPTPVGVASYESGALTTAATMIGAPRVTVDLSATDPSSLQLDARLYDVLPNGDAVLVDRGPRRVRPAEVSAGQVTFELDGNGWRFGAGHRVRIELTQDDSPFVHASTPPSSATLSRVRLAIPVHETTPPPAPKSADLAIDVTDAKDPVTAGKKVTYRLAAHNAGPDKANNVTITDELPDGVGFAPAADAKTSCTADGRTVTCAIGDLASGADATARIKVTTRAPGELTDRATIASDTSDPTSANDSDSETTRVLAARGPCSNLVTGTAKDDRLRGTARGDLMRGLAGGDRMRGLRGADCLHGNAGRDRLNGGRGPDVLAGGAGRDFIDARGGGRDVVRCKPVDRVLAGKRDRLKGCKRDNR